VDVVDVEEGDLAPDGKQKIVLQRGIEVGNIFQLGRKYTQTMGMTYDDEQGKAQVPIMGCYGIGVGRLMSSVMEIRRDEYGPKWPITIAPWQVQINALKMGQPQVKETAEKLYADLSAAGLDVLYDDRDARPGVQFADADLLGIPIRIIVGERNLKDGNVEWKRRDTGDSGTIPLADAVQTIADWVRRAVQDVENKAPESL
jgi:prolyl-tRNA synthetase